MKWLCDEMLAELARWLRSAGHDAALAGQGESDAALLLRCRAEDRKLITRDRRLAGRVPGAILLTDMSLDEQARVLAREYGVDWQLAPFSRCMVDNTVLREASAPEFQRMPEQSRAMPGPFRACPECGRVYWPGSHVRRIEKRLAEWKAACG